MLETSQEEEMLQGPMGSRPGAYGHTELQRAHERDFLHSMPHSGPATLKYKETKYERTNKMDKKRKMFSNTGNQT